jgi:hypothetical protein
VSSVSGQAIVLAAYIAAATTPAAGTSGVNLCVGVAPLQPANQRGQVSQWAVGTWTVGGNVPDAKISLQASTGAGAPVFSFGCGTGNGTSVCDLGAVDASSVQRQLQAEVTVPVTATTVTAVSLTVTGSAANLPLGPAATASVTVSSSAASGASLSPMSAVPIGAGSSTSTLSPGGSVASLFPTVGPGSTPVANVSPIAGGSPLGSAVAEVGGLAALAVAMLLAVTRLSFRRPTARPVGRHAAGSTVAAAPPADMPTGDRG